MLSLIRKGKSRKEKQGGGVRGQGDGRGNGGLPPGIIPVYDGSESDIDQDDRPSSRSSIRSEKGGRLMERPPSRNGLGGDSRHDRPPSRSGRSKQPVLGTLGFHANSLFDEDPGVMSEVETSSSRLRRGTKQRNSYGGLGVLPPRPRTSPSQPSRSPCGASGRGHHNFPYMLADDDPGAMSEAETSTTRLRPISQTLSLGRAGQLTMMPPHSSLMDDDPGIMSEAETSSTRRKNKPKAVLPVVRTPSKTLERPLGLVFLVYRGETKRALLPNEITVIDTVKALFVRSFGKTLTMEYLDSPRVKIYIHDSSKDIFYELEMLSEIKDRTILKLFETDGSGRGPSGLGSAGLPPFTPTPFEAGGEASYVSGAHVRSLKSLHIDEGVSCLPTGPIDSSTLPRNVFSALNSRSFDYGDDFETSRTMPGRSRSNLTGSNLRLSENGRGSKDDLRSVRFASRFVGFDGPGGGGPINPAEAKERMIAMENQLKQITSMSCRNMSKKAPGKKSVSFEKSVSFSDDPPPLPISILNRRQGGSSSSRSSGVGASSTANDLGGGGINSSGGRDAVSGGGKRSSGELSRGGSLRGTSSSIKTENTGEDKKKKSETRSVVSLSMEPELFNQLRGLQKCARELRQEVRVLRRLSQLHNTTMNDLVNDTYLKLREAVIVFATENKYGVEADFERLRVIEDEKLFMQVLSDLLSELKELEVGVEDIRSGVIIRKNKISTQDVENLAITLSSSSKRVAELQKRLPVIQGKLVQVKLPDEKAQLSRLKKFQTEVPEKLENAWMRCKKVTGTLVTLKRLASVQEQRVHPGAPIDVSLSPTPSEIARLPTGADPNRESSLDDLLDALQNFSESSNPESLNSDISEDKSQSSTISRTEDKTQTKSSNNTTAASTNGKSVNFQLPNGKATSSTTPATANGKAAIASTANEKPAIITSTVNVKATNSVSTNGKASISTTANGKCANSSNGKNSTNGKAATSSSNGKSVNCKQGNSTKTSCSTIKSPSNNTPSQSNTEDCKGETRREECVSKSCNKESSSCQSRIVPKAHPPPPPPRTSSAGANRAKNLEKDDSSSNKKSSSKTTPCMNSTKQVVDMTAASSLNRTVATQEEIEASSDKMSRSTNGAVMVKSDSSVDSQCSDEGRRGGGGHIKRANSLTTWTGSGPPPVPSKPDLVKNLTSAKRQEELEMRHQELLARQRQLQEQFQRLQNMQKTSSLPGHTSKREYFNKAGSDTSLTQSSSGSSDSKEESGLRPTPLLTASSTLPTANRAANQPPNNSTLPSANRANAKKIYETDII